MVHALAECRRVLTPGGLLIDLRPFAGNWPLEVARGARHWTVGTLDDSLERPDDQAANAAMAAAVRAGWFVLERTLTFTFTWYWDTLDELEAYIAERWSTVMQLPGETRAAARRRLEAAGPGARLRFCRRMLLGRYRRREAP